MTSTSPPASAQHEPGQTDLKEHVRILRARKWEIGAVTLLVVGATMFFTYRQTPLYQGTAQVLVGTVQNPLNPYAQPAPPNMPTEEQVARSQAVAAGVKRPPGMSVGTLLEHLEVEVIGTTNVLAIHYVDPDPGTAARMADAFAAAYIDFRTQQANRSLQASARAVKVQIDEAKSLLADTTAQLAKTDDPALRSSLLSQQSALVVRLGVLQEQYASLQPSDALLQGAGQIVERASVPTSPASPDKRRNAVLAVLAGLVLGGGLGLLRERLDDRVKTVEELEGTLGAPIIGAIPRAAAWPRPDSAYLVMRSESHGPMVEAYRTLATNVEYLASRRPMKVLQVTSSVAGEGKTATAANLALALAQTGRRVILISADLRRPRAHRFFGMANHAGLSDILSGKMTLAQVAQGTDLGTLRVVPAGPVPMNPAELLGGHRMAELMAMLAELSEYAILDAPPTLACADASILGPRVDATLWVVAADRIQRSALARTRTQLELAGATVVGAVYNDFDPGHSSMYPYNAYYADYDRADDIGARNGFPKAKRGAVRRRGAAVVLERAAAVQRREVRTASPVPDRPVGGANGARRHPVGQLGHSEKPPGG